MDKPNLLDFISDEQKLKAVNSLLSSSFEKTPKEYKEILYELLLTTYRHTEFSEPYKSKIEHFFVEMKYFFDSLEPKAKEGQI